MCHVHSWSRFDVDLWPQGQIYRHTKFWQMGVSQWDNMLCTFLTLVWPWPLTYIWVARGIVSEFYSQFLSCLVMDTNRSIPWNLRSLCVFALNVYFDYKCILMDNWLYKWYFILYENVIRLFGFFLICCSFLFGNTQITCYLYCSLWIT